MLLLLWAVPVLTYGGLGTPRAPCTFPFWYNGTKYEQCTNVGRDRPWCITGGPTNNLREPYEWGYCAGGLVTLLIFGMKHSVT